MSHYLRLHSTSGSPYEVNTCVKAIRMVAKLAAAGVDGSVCRRDLAVFSPRRGSRTASWRERERVEQGTSSGHTGGITPIPPVPQQKVNKQEKNPPTVHLKETHAERSSTTLCELDFAV